MAADRPWRVVVTSPAHRQLNRLAEKESAAVIEAIHAITENPHRAGKPLALELEGHHSTRRGPYRVVYRIDDRKRLITVVAVGHRRDVYRRR